MRSPTPFDPPAGVVADRVALALAEDLEPLGDVSAALLDPMRRVTATIASRATGVLAGVACADETFARVDPAIAVTWHAVDGDAVEPGTRCATVAGSLASIATAERTALNFLGHLSGIATSTRRHVSEALAQVTVWDTRKTTPGLRALEKAAVRAGGGRNHRGNLSEWVMIKDTHLSVMSIADAVAAARDRWPGKTVEVECDSLDQVREALDAGVDLVLLDNMTPVETRECVLAAEEYAAGHGRRPLLEASGGISLEVVRAYAATGVDLVSIGALTNSAPILDLGLDIDTDEGSQPCSS